MSIIKRFFITSGTYFIGNVLSKLIAFFLLPLYTFYFSPEEFGEYDLVVTIISFFAPIAFFQIWDGIFRFSFDKAEIDEKYAVITNSYVVMVLGFTIYTFAFGVLGSTISFNYMWLVYLYGIAIAFQYQYTFISRSFMKNNLFVMSGLLNSIFSAVINITLITKFEFGLESLYIASIVGSLVQIFIIEISLNPLKKINFAKLNLNLQLNMIKFSFPLCIAAVAYWMLSGYTKIVILQNLGSYSNGLFAVAFRFTSMIAIVVTVFQYAWNEMAYLMVGDKNRLLKYQKGINYIFNAVLIGSSIFMLIIKIIFPYFINSAYYEALMIIPLALIGVAANAFANFVGTIFMAEKITKWIFWTTLVASGVNFVMLWILTPIFGLQGSVAALCISFITLAILRLIKVWRIFKINLSYSCIIYISLLLVTVLIFYKVDNTITLSICILMLFGVALYSLKNIFLVFLKKFINSNKYI
ncbi:lipopolysaccharide biosynthesis protein [Exiguobacterium sp. SH5S13]|uniref:lipopolysaccharide biosynthesis protein n=1 Tax=Exiguobacterium sp. SH5S13 TaxID=2510959 RepID=UPI00103E1F0A|nr:oligosaccharide flippase family protein [Exiguobacterium sp. SH5S13]TCI49911.1 lipopolysaccharide biosynthesis protein [Exiguobacterium sp. SH5S13]